MKKLFYIIVVLSLFGCNGSDDVRSILVNIEASGEIEVLPDMASIAVNVSCIDKDLSKSTECTKTSIADLFALLDEHKINRDDYHSSSINLEKEYIWQNNSQVFNGYRSSSTVNIVFRNLETLSVVITKIMTMKDASLNNLNYSHSELDAFANKAYLKAFDNSKMLADEIKNKLGGKSVEVSQISNMREDFSVHGSDAPEEKRLRLSTNEPSMIQVNPGVLKIIRRIYVQYKISL
jgi:uncharacterized protein YggE